MNYYKEIVNVAKHASRFAGGAKNRSKSGE